MGRHPLLRDAALGRRGAGRPKHAFPNVFFIRLNISSWEIDQDNTRVREIESPDLFCCPNWRSAKKAVIQDVFENRSSPVYLFRWDETNERVVSRSIERAEIDESLKDRLGEASSPAELSYEDTLGVLHDLGLPGREPLPDPYKSRLVGRKIDEFTVKSHKGIRGHVVASPAPHLEEPTLQVHGWTVSVDRSPIRAELNKTVVRSGGWSLALRGKGGVSQEIAGLTPGGVYKTTASVRSDSARAKAILRLGDTQGGNRAQDGPRAVSRSRFGPFTVKFLASNTGRARIHLHHTGAPGTLYWDDVRVQSADLDNGAFESGSVRPWKVYGPAAVVPLRGRFEIAISVNGEIVAVTSPGTVRRPDVARVLGSRERKFLYSGWIVFVDGKILKQGSNTIQAYVVPNASKNELIAFRSALTRRIDKRGEDLARSPI